MRVGITERGDASQHFGWIDKLDDVEFAILITKSLNDRFIEEVAKRPQRLVVHATCTGMGGSVIEPRVPNAEWTRVQMDKLAAILPPARIVLRIDPVVPTPKGLETATGVLRLFEDSAVTRVRFSLIDMYRHVFERFAARRVPPPYGSNFQPSTEQRQAAVALFKTWEHRYAIETCAEAGMGAWAAGCISGRDAAACGVTWPSTTARGGQRQGCLCPSAKTELIDRPKAPCAHGCLYCYWQGRTA